MISALCNRYVIAAIALTLTLTAVFGWGYSWGSGSKEAEWQEKHQQALKAQQEQLKKIHSQQIAALQSKNRREHEAKGIRDIPRPGGELCLAGEWVYPISGAVRRANRAASPDTAPATAD